ncbi:3-isopropylmalate dehydratase small subunit [candidate division KSB1 bacterium]|nr:3-isopropylmalate dehydratase small subunit [candidate division KSB1 bacterium]
MEKKITAKVWTFGDDINTDLIIPARYLNTFDPKELAKYCMVDADADFPQKVQPGDAIVAGKNFGCGSSREHAPIALKAAGISCVVAKSFARIFYRNAINIGLAIVECHEDIPVKDGEKIDIDFENGEITYSDRTFESTQFPEFMKELIQAGGLMPWIKARGLV